MDNGGRGFATRQALVRAQGESERMFVGAKKSEAAFFERGGLVVLGGASVLLPPVLRSSVLAGGHRRCR